MIIQKNIYFLRNTKTSILPLNMFKDKPLFGAGIKNLELNVVKINTSLVIICSSHPQYLYPFIRNRDNGFHNSIFTFYFYLYKVIKASYLSNKKKLYSDLQICLLSSIFITLCLSHLMVICLTTG